MPFDHRDNALWPHCLSLNIQVRKNPYDVVPKHPVSSNMGLGKQFAVAFKFRYFYIYYPCRSVSTIGTQGSLSIGCPLLYASILSLGVIWSRSTVSTSNQPSCQSHSLCGIGRVSVSSDFVCKPLRNGPPPTITLYRSLFFAGLKY